MALSSEIQKFRKRFPPPHAQGTRVFTQDSKQWALSIARSLKKKDGTPEYRVAEMLGISRATLNNWRQQQKAAIDDVVSQGLGQARAEDRARLNVSGDVRLECGPFVFTGKPQAVAELVKLLR